MKHLSVTVYLWEGEREMYQNYIFDLYGTLADICTREEDPLVWEKMALFYGYYEARYTPDELKASYERLVRRQQTAGESVVQVGSAALRGRTGREGEKAGKSHEGYPEIQLQAVFEELYREKGAEASEELILHTGQMFRALSTEYICLYPGVKEMLERLRKKGKGIYLLSNAQKIFTEYELHLLGIIRYFDGILISSEHGVKKPDIRFFEILLQTYGLDPKTCLMIGNDGQCDIEGAKKAGMDTCYIHSNISPSEDVNVEATYVQMEMDIGGVCRMLGI